MNVSLMYVIKIFFPSILFHSLKLTSQLYTNKQNIKYYSESWFWGTNLIVFYISFSPRFVHVRIEINVPKIFFNFCFFLLMDEKVDSLSPTFEWLSWNFLTEKKKKMFVALLREFCHEMRIRTTLFHRLFCYVALNIPLLDFDCITNFISLFVHGTLVTN